MQHNIKAVNELPPCTAPFQDRPDAEGTARLSKDKKFGPDITKEDGLLAVTASSFVEVKPLQCSRRPVGLEKVLYNDY